MGYRVDLVTLMARSTRPVSQLKFKMLSQPESSLPCPRKDAIFGRREVRNWHKSKHCFTSLMACLSTSKAAAC